MKLKTLENTKNAAKVNRMLDRIQVSTARIVFTPKIAHTLQINLDSAFNMALDEESKVWYIHLDKNGNGYKLHYYGDQKDTLLCNTAIQNKPAEFPPPGIYELGEKVKVDWNGVPSEDGVEFIKLIKI